MATAVEAAGVGTDESGPVDEEADHGDDVGKDCLSFDALAAMRSVAFDADWVRVVSSCCRSFVVGNEGGDDGIWISNTGSTALDGAAGGATAGTTTVLGGEATGVDGC